MGHPQRVARHHVELAADLLELGVRVDVVAEQRAVRLDVVGCGDGVELGRVRVVAPGHPVERAGRRRRRSMLRPRPQPMPGRRRRRPPTAPSCRRGRGHGGRARGEEAADAHGRPGSGRHLEELPSAVFAHRISHSTLLASIQKSTRQSRDECGVVRSPPYAHLLPQPPPAGRRSAARPVRTDGDDLARRRRDGDPRVIAQERDVRRSRPVIPGSAAASSTARSATDSGRTMSVAGPVRGTPRCGHSLAARDDEHRPASRRSRSCPVEEVRLADEVGHESVDRMIVDLARRAGLDDLAAGHDGDPGRHRERLLLVVGHEHERRADLAMDPRQLGLHLLAELEVEGAERLVEQQHGRPLGQGPGQRDPLLLPAGHLGRQPTASGRPARRARGTRRCGG